MYCKFCGQRADDDAVFCTNCGKQIRAPSDTDLADQAEQVDVPTLELGEPDSKDPSDEAAISVPTPPTPHPRWETLTSWEISRLLSPSERKLWEAKGTPDLRPWDGKHLESWLAPAIQESKSEAPPEKPKKIAAQKESVARAPAAPLKAAASGDRAGARQAQISNSEAMLSVWWLPALGVLVGGLNLATRSSQVEGGAAVIGFFLDASASTGFYSLLSLAIAAIFRSNVSDPKKKMRWQMRFRGSLVWAVTGGGITLAGALIVFALAFS